MNTKVDMGKDKILPLILKMAIPSILAQVVHMLYNIVDKVFIGHISNVGVLALAGIGVLSPIIIVITASINLIAIGGGTRAAIALGEQNINKAKKVLGTSIILLLIISASITIIGNIFITPILQFFNISEDVFPFSKDYLGVYIWGTIPSALYLGLCPFLTAQGLSLESMFCVVAGAICNIILDPILIFTFDLGIKGAAIATVISQFVSAIMVYIFLKSKRNILSIDIKEIRLDITMVWPIIAVGLAPFTMQFTEGILSTCFNTSLQKYGGDIAVSAFTIATSIMHAMDSLYTGYSQGAQPVVSYNFGAKNRDRLVEATKVAVIGTLLIGMAFWIFMQTMPEVFVSLFTDDEELISYATDCIKIYSFGFVIVGLQLGCQYILIALGRTFTSFLMAINRKFVLLIPLIYILPMFMDNKVYAVLSAEPIADICASIVTTITMIFTLKKVLNSAEFSSNGIT